MDARFRRSQEALRAAALELAQTRSAAELSVTDVCREAGVTRDTFYRHADSPLALVSATLADDLASVVDRHREASDSTARLDDLNELAREVLEHVARFADVYRAATSPKLPDLLRAVLEDVLHKALADHLRSRSSTLPPGVKRSDTVRIEMAAAYAAGGAVSAIETWLRHGSTLSAKAAATTITNVSPGFWFGER